MGFPDWQCFVGVIRRCWENQAPPHVSTGRGSWKSAPGFSGTLFYAPFTFTDFNLYYFTAINCNCVCDSISAFCQPSSESVKLRVVLRIPCTRPKPPPVHNLLSM